MTDKSADEARFDELLPFYLNKSLNASDQAWMEGHISTHAHAKQQLQFEKILRDTVQQTQPRRTETERIKQLLKALEADRKSKSPLHRVTSWWKALTSGLGPSDSSSSSSLLGRLSELMTRPAGVSSAAVAMVAVLFVAQSVFLVIEMSQTRQEQVYRGDRPECQTTVSRLRVVFTPDTRHVEIVLLLRKLEISVREGPSEIGEFWLNVPAGRSLDEALAMLRTSALVEEAMMVRESRFLPGCVK
jgi:hypothetical protein